MQIYVAQPITSYHKAYANRVSRPNMGVVFLCIGTYIQVSIVLARLACLALIDCSSDPHYR